MALFRRPIQRDELVNVFGNILVISRMKFKIFQLENYRARASHAISIAIGGIVVCKFNTPA